MCSTTATTGGDTNTKKVKKRRSKANRTTSITCEQATQDHEIRAVGAQFTYYGPNSPGSCHDLPELDTNICLDKEDDLKFSSDTYDGCF
ncbi:hypothetical protein PFICI_11149 [Pestalotiopsis fici W106-1]|uniref:Uncharacterized protein n=1 Tax=Pestalotiopsis fici (strain W106-1 / CGMCC3.15140) TaxID=1229662 RepID=W3WTU7_PESFW|nr:uncharacterized protein PFICI_11149 [Pestalotiopsis fici W106-1]ETS77275.1 hypothetical protein PFICI_11149 [Pestalotiopsis fici W106-1]